MQASAAYERVVSSAAVRAVLEDDACSGWVIAGGAALSIASGAEIAHGDVDLFCMQPSAPYSALKLAHLLKSALESEGAEVTVRVSKMAYTLSTISLTLQIISHRFSSFEALFEHFDLPCCEFAYDPRASYVLSSDRGLLSERTRVVDRAQIRMRKAHLLPARESKYAARGFRFEGEFTSSSSDVAVSVMEAYYRAPVNGSELPALA
jgi:hypothetical protein